MSDVNRCRKSFRSSTTAEPLGLVDTKTQESGIRNQESGIRNQESNIKHQTSNGVMQNWFTRRNH
ncbi:hypothetical protein OAE79_02280, partial [Rhodopirellula sp.]